MAEPKGAWLVRPPAQVNSKPPAKTIAVPGELDIRTVRFRDDGVKVYSGGILCGWYHDLAPSCMTNTRCRDAHEDGRPIHAVPLLTELADNHFATPQTAIDGLVRALGAPRREPVEIYDSVDNPEEGVREAVRYARGVLNRRLAG